MLYFLIILQSVGTIYRIKFFLEVGKAYIKVSVTVSTLFNDSVQYNYLVSCTVALPEDWRSL